MGIGDRIRIQREKLNMSQEELAKKLGYSSRSTVNKIEKGINDITQSKIVAFAKALNVTPSYLMGWDEQEEIEPKVQHHEITSTILSDNRLMELILLFNSLTEENKNKIYDYCKYIHDTQEKGDK